MKYKLYYTNECGQIVLPTGELFKKSNSCSDYYEIFNSLDETKINGKAFLEKHPLMTCTIYCGNDYDSEIILSPNEDLLKKHGQKRN